MDEKIVLTVRKLYPNHDSRVVRITEKAADVLTSIRRQTGLSASYVVSQLIIQGAPLVEVVEEE